MLPMCTDCCQLWLILFLSLSLFRFLSLSNFYFVFLTRYFVFINILLTFFAHLSSISSRSDQFVFTDWLPDGSNLVSQTEHGSFWIVRSVLCMYAHLTPTHTCTHTHTYTKSFILFCSPDYIYIYIYTSLYWFLHLSVFLVWLWAGLIIAVYPELFCNQSPVQSM